MELESLLTARPSRRRDLGVWYSQVLEAAEREGVTIPELAQKLGCCQETVYSWRRRLRRAENHSSPTPTGLVRVQVAEPLAPSDSSRLEVRTRTGRAVLVPNDFDASALATVVAVLERC